MTIGAPGRFALDQLDELMDFSMKLGANFALRSLNFAVNQDREITCQDDPRDASFSSHTANKAVGELSDVNQGGASSEDLDLRRKLGLSCLRGLMKTWFPNHKKISAKTRFTIYFQLHLMKIRNPRAGPNLCL
jgi:hypothetical protein